MTLDRTDIVSRSASMDLSDSYFDSPAVDWYTDWPIPQYPNLDPVASEDASLFRRLFGFSLPFPLPTDGFYSAYTSETLLDTPPFQPVRRDGLLSPPAVDVPGPSRFQLQTTAMPLDNDVRNRDDCYKGTTGGGPWVISGTHAPPMVPTTLSPAPSLPLAATFPLNWIKVPQRSYDHGRKQWSFKRLESVSFSVGGRPGINLGDALHKTFEGLDNRDDPVLQDASGAISCRFLFPGYPANSGPCQINTLDWTRKRLPITRNKLAYEVARKLERYLHYMAKFTPDGSVENQWTIGQGFMHIDNMFLVRLVSVSKGSFQPEIWIADPSTADFPLDLE